MKQGQHANSEEELEMKAQIKSCKDYQRRLRLNVLYCYYKGFKLTEVADMLCLPVSTVWQYITDYKKEKKTDHTPRGGKEEKLNKEQTQALTKHLEEKTYLKVEEIIRYVTRVYRITYSKSGMKSWLQRHRFVYKKPKPTPAKLDPEKQEEFVKAYFDMRDHAGPDEVIVFMDGVHPAHQTQAVHGWIKRGKEVCIRTTAKQPRIHFMGALTVNHPDKPLFQEFDKINSESIVAFLDKINNHFAHKKKITVICDNAGYHKGKPVQAFLSLNPQVQMVFLPPYSPNLNPIERLWKVLREFVIYNKFYPSFDAFRSAIFDFFDKKVPQIPHLLKCRINDNFQVISPTFIRL